MEYFTRKIWYSVFVSMIILVTCLTTTYAWYTSSRTNNIDRFDFDIVGERDVLISTDGKMFKDELTSADIMRSIFSYRGIDTKDYSDHKVKTEFEKLWIDPVTPKDYSDLTKGFTTTFKSNTQIDSNFYFAFDIYFSTDTPSYIEDGKEYGEVVSFTEDIPFKANNTTIDLTDYNFNPHPVFENINKPLKVNLKNAMRMGFLKYDSVKLREESTSISSNVIYTFSSEKPTVENEVYSFGGINSEFNLGLEIYNQEMGTSLRVPENDRKDILFNANTVINNTDKLYAGRMIKTTFFLWIEGWDSDSLDAMTKQFFEFKLGFSLQN